MNKKIYIIVLIFIIASTVVVDFSFILSPNKNVVIQNVIENTKSTSPKDATYVIDGQSVTLVGGVSSVPAAPGSASMITTQYFGNEVVHDFDGDGRPDTAFILTQNTGGSGTFYYVVAALNKINGYIGSNAVLLGDRIAPETVEMSQNPATPDVIVVNYADRKPEDSFVIPPSVGKSIWLKLDINTMQFGEVTQQ
jgi:hypothetical protein